MVCGHHDPFSCLPALAKGGSHSAPHAAVKNGSLLPPDFAPVLSSRLGRDDTSYHAEWNGASARLVNPAQSLQARFTARAIEISAGQDQWNIALAGFGYDGRMSSVKPIMPEINANRVEYRRGALTEWYVNGPLGIEQGFTLAKAPLKSGRVSSKPNGPLTISLSRTGDLTASVDDGGRALTLSRNGIPSLHYSGLSAIDARGRKLHAWLELASNQLQVRVDDSGAIYPLTIDPYVEAAELTAPGCDSSSCNSFNFPGSQLGNWVAISSDGSTVVASAPGTTDSDGGRIGAAYVFVKPSGGWTDATDPAKLTASTSTFLLGLASVAISSDGGTVVVGDFEETSGNAAYVFVRPSGGWSGLCTKLQS